MADRSKSMEALLLLTATAVIGGCSSSNKSEPFDGGTPEPTGGTPSVVAQGAWGADAMLRREVVPAGASGKPGELHGPASLVVSGSDLLILDPVGGRLVRLALGSANFEAADQGSFYRGALDLVESGAGDRWVLGGQECGCVRRITGSGAVGVDLLVAPALYPGRLSLQDGQLSIAAADGLHVLWRDGAPLTPDQQVDETLGGVRHPRLDVTLSAAIRDDAPKAVHVIGRRTDASVAFDHVADVRGRPSEVRLVAPGCGDSILVVVLVTRSDGLAEVMVRLDAEGRPLNQVVVPLPADFGAGVIPFRSFTVSEGGQLYQLTTGGDGYAIATWPTGC